MNVKIFASALAVGIMVASNALATEWHVYSAETAGRTGTQQLTNAFACAQSGDTITIHAGTYNVPTEEMMFRYETSSTVGSYHATAGTCLYTATKNLTIQGDPDVSRDEVVLSGLGANAESSNGQHQILLLGGSDCTIKHLTFYKGYADYNAYVYRKGEQINTDKWVFRRGGGLRGDKTTVVEDCIFEDCYAGHGACIYNAASATNCRFLRGHCVANNNGSSLCCVKTVLNSYFSGCRRGSARESTLVSNCVFVACGHTDGHGMFHYPTKMRVLDSVFTNCTTEIFYFTGQKFMASEVSRCTLYNTSTSAYPLFYDGNGGYLFTAPITDCTFEGNFPFTRVTGKISRCTFKATGVPIMTACSELEDCTVDGGGKTLTGNSTMTWLEIPAILEVGAVRRCRLGNFSCHWAYAIKNCHRMENSLITRTVQWGGTGALFGHTDGVDATYLNCTVTTNGSMNNMFAVTNSAEIATGNVTVKNCLFHNNKVGGQSWGVCDSWSDDLSHVYLYNTYHHFRPTVGGSVNSVNGRKTDFNPRMKEDGTLHRLSCCVNAGTNDAWTAKDIDLVKNGRLNGTVDVGCYENWDLAPGCLILFK